MESSGSVGIDLSTQPSYPATVTRSRHGTHSWSPAPFAISPLTAHNRGVNGEALSDAIIREIIELHAVFEQWFCGEGPTSLDRVERVLAPDFTLVPPNGSLVRRSQLMIDLAQARGSRPTAITIEHPKMIWRSSDSCLAAYEEVQHHEGYTTRRRSTALFLRSDLAPNGVVWQHVHETWVQPPAQ